MAIWISSDLHLFHTKPFLYEPRGFNDVLNMNKTIIDNFNSVVAPDDDLFLLGDLLLGGSTSLEDGLGLLTWLNGKLHLVRGNHDSDKRWAAYKTLPNVVEMENAIFLKYNKYHFYLSHFPTICSNYDDKGLKHCMIGLCGHTHTKDPFLNMDKGLIFHTEVDTNNCYPWLLDDIIEKTKEYLDNKKS